jgi:cell wall-associated NlpC family hydrolase
MGLVAQPTIARAASITQTKREIANLSAKLAQEERQGETTANQYDAAKVRLANISTDITRLQGEEVAKRAQVAQTAIELQTSVVSAYVDGASAAQTVSLFNQNVTTSDSRKVYEDQVIGNLNQLQATYVNEKQTLDSTIAQVSVQRTNAEQQTNAIAGLLSQNIANVNSTRSTLAVVTTALKGEIINYEIQAGVDAARSHNVAGEEQAVLAATEVGGQSAANQVTQAIQSVQTTISIAQVGSSAQGLAAVRNAEREIGVPYVWGGETPGAGFDCSGLVQWAWGQAGISIPRTTETQWPDMVHVSLLALQPGDLLFYYNLDGDHAVDHVVMYVGSGPYGANTIIAAAHTGTNVSFAPLFTAGLIGAARP